eukprot:scaffold355660_cov55-Attheya_sp.AAC.1
MGTPVTIKDPEAVEKSMISGHFKPGVEHRTEVHKNGLCSTVYANSSYNCRSIRYPGMNHSRHQ